MYQGQYMFDVIYQQWKQQKDKPCSEMQAQKNQISRSIKGNTRKNRRN